MIVKIQPANPGIKSAVLYNERKMTGEEGIRESEDPELEAIEDGHVLATRNVPQNSTLLEEFDKLDLATLKKRRSGPRLKNIAFHMSVNPSETDRKLSEKEAVAFIDEIMKGLGYAGQPYRIYEHTDILRKHYHVVSCRATQQGKKVQDSYERMKLRTLLKGLQNKYGFEVVLNEAELARKEERQQRKEAREKAIPAPIKNINKETQRKRDDFVRPFSRKRPEPVTQQLTEAYKDAMRWHFSTFEQLQSLMQRRYNIEIGIQKNETEGTVFMQGTKPSGDLLTPMIFEKELGLKLLKEIEEKTRSEKMSQRKEQRVRLEKLAMAVAENSDNYKEFLETMQKKGVWVVLSWQKDMDKPFGVTYLDRATRCAWKGSETKTDLVWLKDIAEKKGWTLEKDPIQEKIQKRNAQPARRTMTEKTDYNPSPAKPTAPAGTPILVKTDQHNKTHKRAASVGHQTMSNADVTKDKGDMVQKKEEEKNKKYIGE